MFFFSKPPVFKVNIHNLLQFVNHTVTLVQNKNNNERLLWNEGYVASVWKKTYFFQTMFILEKNFFSRFGFSLQFYFSKKNLNASILLLKVVWV